MAVCVSSDDGRRRTAAEKQQSLQSLICKYANEGVIKIGRLSVALWLLMNSNLQERGRGAENEGKEQNSIVLSSFFYKGTKRCQWPIQCHDHKRLWFTSNHCEGVMIKSEPPKILHWHQQTVQHIRVSLHSWQLTMHISTKRSAWRDGATAGSQRGFCSLRVMCLTPVVRDAQVSWRGMCSGGTFCFMVSCLCLWFFFLHFLANRDQ